jgi:membrane protein
MSVAIAVSVWSASAAVLGTMNALNVVYKVTERRPTWKRFIVSIVYTLALALMLIIAAGLMITGPVFLTWLAGYVWLDSYFITVWAWVRWPVAAFILLLVISLVYYAAPNVNQPFRLTSPGAVFAVASWIGASLAFGYYVQHFSRYNATYGSMGAVIVLLLFFFLSAAVVLLGAEVNAAIDRERGERVEEA